MKELPLAIIMNTPILKLVKNGMLPNCAVLYMATGCPKIPTSINKEQIFSQLAPVYYAAHPRTVTLRSKTCTNVPALIES